MVSAEQFENALAQAAEQALMATGNRASGLFGPGSMSWQVNREMVLLLGGGAAALLQLAHPFVAQAVAEHSRLSRDVAGRFRRTFTRILTMTFGDLDSALAAARRVRAIHDRVAGRFHAPVGRYAAGSAYAANDAGAVLWVLATLIDTSAKVFQGLVRPFSASEPERFYQSDKRMGLFFGLLPEELPQDWPAFQRYYAGMLSSSTLCVGPAARELAAHVLSPPNRAVRPLYRFLRAYTAALLPARLRRDFGLSYGPAERALLAVALPSLRAFLRTLPPALRYFPGYLDAQHRLAGETGIDVASHRTARRALRLLRPSFVLGDLLR